MPKVKTEYQVAVGALVSAIQKEWHAEAGTSTSEFSNDVLDAAHSLLQCRDPQKAVELLGPLSVQQFLGEVWIRRHRIVLDSVSRVQAAIEATKDS
jgi:hypothetical protein